MFPRAAVIIVFPVVVRAVARPVVGLIVATLVLDEDQVTEVVMTLVVVSLYVPVATNCCVALLAMVGAVGVTAIETSVAAVTVSVTGGDVIVVAGIIAVMLVVPTATGVARPWGATLLMVAVAGVDDAHVTWVVRF
jgi:hypothetical protein